ncbi:MAG: hypothetical protein A2355_06100 [Spirochaetes bacterium RIFOXYB1_FULL_32_8]|nr:MAG: hypothetical protein A2Y30_03225 [Spirochaetes bacterium GWE1_32_154]OHD48212.1 MAG: hypothetical protein A2Y29_07420 [Spirochaetes bacterium GWE2_31_10]OHD74131.1 MAG: hypothetical protein A2355_06100 [Spirochaetes bacterium RIFOXYB1_FULL_32_8]
MKLPDTILKFATIFKNNNFSLFLVGGAVRDALLGEEQFDYDFTTDATPEQVMSIFKKVIPVGIDHGTVLVLFGNSEFEVTTFRTEGKYSDNRRPDSVSFVNTIDEDLKRRDFTINAIAYDIFEEKFIDLFNGAGDIQSKIIKAIGNPAERFQEDALRMLRACRFASKLEFTIEHETLQAITSHCELIKNISSERIRDELIKLMGTKKPSIGLEIMRITGLMNIIMPELLAGYGIEQNRFHAFDVYYHNLYSCDAAPANNYQVRLAALFHDIAKPQTSHGKPDDEGNSFYNHEIIGSKMTYRIMRRLKFSKSDLDTVSHLIRYHMFYYTAEWTDGAVRRFLRNVGVENLDNLFLLRDADRVGNGTKHGIPKTFLDFKEKIVAIIADDNALKVTDLAINGNDLISALGLKPGKIIGEILNYLLELVLDTPDLNTNKKLIESAKEYYNNKESHSTNEEKN